MKGFLIKDLEYVKGNRKQLFMLLGIAVFMQLATHMSVIFCVTYFAVVLSMMAMNTIICDEPNMPFLLTMPISRKGYVREKYSFCFAFAGAAWALGMILSCVVELYRGNLKLDELSYVTIGTLAAICLIIGFYVPVQLKYGAEKGRIILFVFCFGGSALVLGIKELLSKLGVYDDIYRMIQRFFELDEKLLTGIMIVVLILLVLLSYRISVRIVEKKEY